MTIQRNDKTWSYALYWLTVVSDFELPEAAPIGKWDAGPTVFIHEGTVPEELAGGVQIHPWVEYSGAVFLFTIPGVARLLIQDGERITVEITEGGNENDMRVYLLGSGLGTLLHQRRLLPLHMSAVESPEGVIGITGDSGAGKSTLAATLHFDKGWPLLSDDVVGLRFIDGAPWIYSGVRRLKLWKDAIARFGLENRELIRDHSRCDKFHLLDPEMFVDTPRKLVRLVVLGEGAGEGPEHIKGAKAFSACTKAIYRPEIARLINSPYAPLELAKVLSGLQTITRTNRKSFHYDP